MKDNKQFQYYTKIAGALNSIFDKDSERFIDVFDDNFSANDFIHVLATRVPQMVVAKLTNNKFDPLEFNHFCNKLIMQDRIDNHK
ncbi:hypothetical protein JE945_001131 [Flavobacterium psychrophilum]|nr:hypothetical protein [Flavobacterium psychrophilum]